MKQSLLVFLVVLTFACTSKAQEYEEQLVESEGFLPIHPNTVRILSYSDVPQGAFNDDQLKNGGFILYIIG